MMIEIQCGNFSDFDAAKGRYVECGEKIIVSSDQVGEMVTCTKCQQQIEVPYGIGESDAASPSNRKTQQAPEQKPKRGPASTSAAVSPVEYQKRRSSQPTSEPKRRTDRSDPARSPDRQSKPNQNSPSKNATGSGTSRRNPSTERTQAKSAAGRTQSKSPSRSRSADTRVKKTDVMSMDFGDQHVTSTVSEDRKERCKKCGNLVENGQCTICKFVEPKFEKLHQPLEQIEIELAGFQRWFCLTINEGVSVRVLEYVAHGLLGFIGLFLLAAAFAGIFGFGLGTVGGIVLLVGVCFSVLVYVGLIYKGHQFLKDPHARLAWFQLPFWNLVLYFARLMKWESYDSRLKNRKIIKVRERMFRDHEIHELEGLSHCQVLDLEGTSVTDAGLLDLYGLKYLQCVVLRRTNVTHEGVFRLQQSFPRLWIWY